MQDRVYYMQCLERLDGRCTPGCRGDGAAEEDGEWEAGSAAEDGAAAGAGGGGFRDSRLAGHASHRYRRHPCWPRPASRNH